MTAIKIGGKILISRDGEIGDEERCRTIDFKKAGKHLLPVRREGEDGEKFAIQPTGLAIGADGIAVKRLSADEVVRGKKSRDGDLSSGKTGEQFLRPVPHAVDHHGTFRRRDRIINIGSGKGTGGQLIVCVGHKNSFLGKFPSYLENIFFLCYNQNKNIRRKVNGLLILQNRGG